MASRACISSVDYALRMKSPVMVACEVLDLNEMLADAVDNACKRAKTRVILRMEGKSSPGFLTVVAEDDGPGLSPRRRRSSSTLARSGGIEAGLRSRTAYRARSRAAVRRRYLDLGGLRVQLELPEFVQGC